MLNPLVKYAKAESFPKYKLNANLVKKKKKEKYIILPKQIT